MKRRVKKGFSHDDRRNEDLEKQNRTRRKITARKNEKVVVKKLREYPPDEIEENTLDD